MSMFLLPSDTPGIEIVRPTRYMGEDEDGMDHPHVRYHDVRMPAEGLLGEVGDGFLIAQTRLSGGRIHHAMRAVGQAQYAFDMMCERALSRTSGGRPVAEKQMVQEAIAESYAQIEQFRLFVLRTAWKIDQGKGYTPEVRREIAIAKVLSAKVMRDVLERAVHLHGALGTSNETPLANLVDAGAGLRHLGRPDGKPRDHGRPAAAARLLALPDLWPTQWLPARREEARKRYAGALAEQAAAEVAVGSPLQ